MFHKEYPFDGRNEYQYFKNMEKNKNTKLKSTGNKIEMTWKKWSDGYDIEMMKVDGKLLEMLFFIVLILSMIELVIF